jgi:hypothetical protein
MQNRYSGDIGDYVKLAILRHFAEGRRLGVAWWLFPDESNGDGRHIGYLTDPDNWERYDPALFRGLSAVVKSGKRYVGAMHQFLPTGTCFSCDEIPCDVQPYSRRPLEREKWLQKVKANLAGCDVVFLDPDNGLEPPGFRSTRRRAGKSVQYSELAELNERGRAMIVYHHYFRQPHEAQVKNLAEKIKQCGILRVDVLRWHRISPRAFFVLNAGSDTRQRADALANVWDGHLTWHLNVA